VAQIALFGGSGRTGQQVLEQALRAGHGVRALARKPESITQRSPLLTVVHGDVLDPAAVSSTISGTDTVISVFGHVKGSPAAVQTEGTRNIVEAMKAHGQRRIVSLSGGGLPYPEKDEPQLPDKAIRLLLRILSPKVLKDAEGHLRVLEESGLEWTVVRGPVLTNAALSGRYRVGWVGVDAGMKLGRADLAHFILAEALAPAYVRQLPFVSY
jgi:putative NADH-flavin reductase